MLARSLMTLCTRGFGRIVTSATAPIATGWADRCPVGISPEYPVNQTVKLVPNAPCLVPTAPGVQREISSGPRAIALLVGDSWWIPPRLLLIADLGAPEGADPGPTAVRGSLALALCRVYSSRKRGLALLNCAVVRSSMVRRAANRRRPALIGHPLGILREKSRCLAAHSRRTTGRKRPPVALPHGQVPTYFRTRTSCSNPDGPRDNIREHSCLSAATAPPVSGLCQCLAAGTLVTPKQVRGRTSSECRRKWLWATRQYDLLRGHSALQRAIP